jgi:hypothetical protein
MKSSMIIISHLFNFESNQQKTYWLKIFCGFITLITIQVFLTLIYPFINHPRLISYVSLVFLLILSLLFLFDFFNIHNHIIKGNPLQSHCSFFNNKPISLPVWQHTKFLQLTLFHLALNAIPCSVYLLNIFPFNQLLSSAIFQQSLWIINTFFILKTWVDLHSAPSTQSQQSWICLAFVLTLFSTSILYDIIPSLKLTSYHFFLYLTSNGSQLKNSMNPILFSFLICSGLFIYCLIQFYLQPKLKRYHLQFPLILVFCIIQFLITFTH